MLSRRRMEDEVWRRNIKRSANELQRLAPVSIDIEVHVANFLEALLSAAVGAVLDRIHTDKNVGASAVLFQKCGLEFGAHDDFRFRDALKSVTQPSISNENGDVIRGLKKSANIFWRCQRFGREKRWSCHDGSCFAA